MYRSFNTYILEKENPEVSLEIIYDDIKKCVQNPKLMTFSDKNVYLEAFHYTCCYGNIEVIEQVYEYILKNDATFNIEKYVGDNKSEYGYNYPYIPELSNKKHLIVLQWLKNEADKKNIKIDWTVKNGAGRNIFNTSCLRNNLDTLKFLMNEYDEQHLIKKYYEDLPIIEEDSFLDDFIHNYYQLLEDGNIECAKWLHNELSTRHIISGSYGKIIYNKQVNSRIEKIYNKHIFVDGRRSYSTILLFFEELQNSSKNNTQDYAIKLLDNMCNKNIYGFYYNEHEDKDELLKSFNYVYSKIDDKNVAHDILKTKFFFGCAKTQFLDLLLKFMNLNNINLDFANKLNFQKFHKYVDVEWFYNHKEIFMMSIYDLIDIFINQINENITDNDNMIFVINKIEESINSHDNLIMNDYCKKKLADMKNLDKYFESVCANCGYSQKIYNIFNITIGFELHDDLLLNIYDKYCDPNYHQWDYQREAHVINICKFCVENNKINLLFAYKNNAYENIFYKACAISQVKVASYLKTIEPSFNYVEDELSYIGKIESCKVPYIERETNEMKIYTIVFEKKKNKSFIVEEASFDWIV